MRSYPPGHLIFPILGFFRLASLSPLSFLVPVGYPLLLPCQSPPFYPLLPVLFSTCRQTRPAGSIYRQSFPAKPAPTPYLQVEFSGAIARPLYLKVEFEPRAACKTLSVSGEIVYLPRRQVVIPRNPQACRCIVRPICRPADRHFPEIAGTHTFATRHPPIS